MSASQPGRSYAAYRTTDNLETNAAPITRRRFGPLAGVRQFAQTENSSALVLLLATIVALVWANSAWADSYEALWQTEFSINLGSVGLSLDLRHWVNDGLMALFFFVAGLEIRREVDMGELQERRKIAAPVVAAVGGMVVPALIYLAFNVGQESVRGWGIVMGTDTAFALGVLTLVGGSSARVRAFLLSMVVFDDVVALAVIAVVYTDNLSLLPLGIAGVLVGVVFALRAAHVQNGAVYLVVGLGLWLAVLSSGVHATIAGVAMGLLATAYPPRRNDLSRARSSWKTYREEPTPALARAASRSMALSVSPNERLQYLFHPWTSFFVVPVFALANAGVQINPTSLGEAATSPITLGIVGGLVVGKLVGITGFSWVGSKLAGFPIAVPWPQMFGIATLAGIGFTVSLLIADISFDGIELAEAKIGVLFASAVAALLSWVAFRLAQRFGDRTATGAASSLVDLSDPVDPEVDHLRGSPDAPLVLVEYGDFECPYCLRVETVLDRLFAEFGDDLTFVFRHLPLDEVHDNARLAAEAAEAAAAQGKFWEMHDLLFRRQARLDLEAIMESAEEIGLDMDRFSDDLRDRRYSLRVERDVISADDSGAVGTPTFFINGRRYRGTHRYGNLLAELRDQLALVRARQEEAGDLTPASASES